MAMADDGSPQGGRPEIRALPPLDFATRQALAEAEQRKITAAELLYFGIEAFLLQNSADRTIADTLNVLGCTETLHMSARDPQGNPNHLVYDLPEETLPRIETIMTRLTQQHQSLLHYTGSAAETGDSRTATLTRIPTQEEITEVVKEELAKTRREKPIDLERIRQAQQEQLLPQLQLIVREDRNGGFLSAALEVAIKPATAAKRAPRQRRN